MFLSFLQVDIVNGTSFFFGALAKLSGFVRTVSGVLTTIVLDIKEEFSSSFPVGDIFWFFDTQTALHRLEYQLGGPGARRFPGMRRCTASSHAWGA